MLAFNELMRRVRPMQEVKKLRDEIKVRKIERLGNKTGGVSCMTANGNHNFQIIFFVVRTNR